MKASFCKIICYALQLIQLLNSYKHVYEQMPDYL